MKSSTTNNSRGGSSSSSESRSSSNKGLAAKLQNLIEENEETIHLILEIAAMTIEKADMGEKQRRISRAALALVSEIMSPDEDGRSSHKTRLEKSNVSGK